MREIKFRAWDGERMHAAFDLTQNPVFWWQESYDYPLMQHTGLKDKNGVEIYEGDIILWVDEEGGLQHYSVEWGEGDGTWWAEGQWLAELLPVVTVVGNIYENPELLGESNANA